MMRPTIRTGWLLPALLLLPLSALAHTGAGPVSGWLAGFSHPIGGLDHLLAMLAVGLWAGQLGGRARWVVPATFVGVMLLGGLLGMSGLPLPLVEGGILLSLLVLGGLIALAAKAPLSIGVLVVGVFALFHGHAHGTEMAPALGGLAYSAGFALATALLHLAGIAIAQGARRLDAGLVTRLAGGAVAASGVFLAVGG